MIESDRTYQYTGRQAWGDNAYDKDGRYRLHCLNNVNVQDMLHAINKM